ncbi:MAG TPA: GntR family transcriptional regulator [Candidatus Limnocylindrales bacterium]
MAKQTIVRIKRSTLSSVVTDRLRELVISGAYEPGAQLSEVELAEQFGVSRGPIREGLQRLVQDGLLRSEPHRGVFVPKVGSADIADIYLAREAIEGAAIRIVMASEGRATVVATLRDLVRQMRAATAAGKWARVADFDMRFHLEVVRASGSPRLQRMYSTLIDETRVVMSMTANVPGREDYAEEHDEIADRIEGGSVDSAVSTLARTFRESKQTLTTQAAQVGHPGRDGTD